MTTLSRGATLDGFAKHRLGPVGGRSVEQVDAQIQGLANNCDGFSLALAGAEAQAAETAAT